MTTVIFNTQSVSILNHGERSVNPSETRMLPRCGLLPSSAPALSGKYAGARNGNAITVPNQITENGNSGPGPAGPPARGRIAYAVSSITAFIVEGELKDILGRRKMEKEIAKLQDHFIICGSDETARTIIEELTLTRRPFVVVEPSQERLDRLSLEFRSLLMITGDPSEDPVPVAAGIERAKGIFLSMPTDEANLFIAITARNLNEGIRIVAKGIGIKSQNKFLKAGADHVVSPTFIGGMRRASQMIWPAVVNFLDLMLIAGPDMLDQIGQMFGKA